MICYGESFLSWLWTWGLIGSGMLDANHANLKHKEKQKVEQ